ncbi:TPA: hypothetical protein P0E22_005182 [Vibrio harveyi]|nr:hypothetical protein [Vibrio harveyi]
MEKQEYISKASNPDEWFKCAFVQKKVADKILKLMLDDDEIIGNSELFKDLWGNAHYHYGIALENGFKGMLVSRYPDKVKFQINGDKVRLKGLGDRQKLSHNLVDLAEEAGIFELGLHKYESDEKALRIVLAHLTDSVKWSPKYPVPIDNKSMFKFDNTIPVALVYGFYILDVMSPVFEVFKENSVAHA